MTGLCHSFMRNWLFLSAGFILITKAVRDAVHLEAQVEAQVELPLLEPTYQRYLFQDPFTNELHVMLPVVGGDEFSLDNTCKAVLEVQRFMLGKGKDPSAGQTLMNYREKLEFDLWLLGEMAAAGRTDDGRLPAVQKAKAARLEQLGAYITVLDPVMDRFAKGDALKGEHPRFPAALSKTIAESRNLLSMRLVPEVPDIQLRFLPHAFGVVSKNKFYQSKFAKGLFQTLQDSGAPPAVQPAMAPGLTLEDHVFIEDGGLKREDAATEPLYTRMQNRIRSYFQAKNIPIAPLKYRTLAAMAEGLYMDVETMQQAYDFTIYTDFAMGIPEGEGDAPGGSLLSREVQKSFEGSAGGRPGRASILVQAFLGLLNLHYRAYVCNADDPMLSGTAVCGNLWEYLEANHAESAQEIYEQLKAADPEEALISWASEKYFKSPLTDDLKKKLNERFSSFWQTVQDADKLDEWLVHFKDLPGLGVSYQSTISLHFGEYFARQEPTMLKETKEAQEFQQAAQTLKGLAESFKGKKGELARGGLLPHKNTYISHFVKLDDEWLLQLAMAAEPARAAQVLLMTNPGLELQSDRREQLQALHTQLKEGLQTRGDWTAVSKEALRLGLSHFFGLG